MDLREAKRQLRQQALAAREAQADKDGLSRRIMDRLLELPAYQQARTVMLYIGVRDEVRTQDDVPRILASGRGLVVPFCQRHELGLFRLSDLNELEPSGFGLLEPLPSVRTQADRLASVQDLDVIAVPGLAFDRRGARLGYGKAYYDRLLAQVRPDTVLVGLAFECQMFPQVPTGRRDVFLDLVITERGLYPGSGRRNRERQAARPRRGFADTPVDKAQTPCSDAAEER
ncbi:MAG: 5-formyltetrahydrofolate cyclo-ligase [Candidatus Anammoximicrobium sp.]|nr:5-formyltetrahydrofolate cyclo-ligase [Candidatus Anammoximicrobium sp.]